MRGRTSQFRLQQNRTEATGDMPQIAPLVGDFVSPALHEPHAQAAAPVRMDGSGGQPAWHPARGPRRPTEIGLCLRKIGGSFSAKMQRGTVEWRGCVAM